MKCSYGKRTIFKLFNLKIFEKYTDYIEHSRDEDSDENDFFIELKTAEKMLDCRANARNDRKD